MNPFIQSKMVTPELDLDDDDHLSLKDKTIAGQDAYNLVCDIIISISSFIYMNVCP